MEEKKNIPEIRFKGFEGEWEENIFGSTFTYLTSNTLSRAELNYKTGTYKNIHYGDVLIKFGELLDIRNDQIPFITHDKVAEKINSSILQNGDVIIADTAEDESVGKCTELINIRHEKAVAGLHTIPVRPIDSFASKYLGYYMNSPSFHNQLIQLMQGIKVLSVSKSSIKNTTIKYPAEKKEQSQIGSFFQNLDKQITLEQKKYDKLVTLKKAMLEKMFPKEGANVPELRFKGFEGKWEEKVVEDLCSMSTGKSNTQDQTSDGIYPFYIRSEIPARSNKYIFDCEAVLTIGDGNIGKVFHYVNGKFDLHQRVYRMYDFKGILGKYFYYYFSARFYKRAMKMTAKATVDSVRLEMISEMKIKMPISLREQNAIAEYFQNLDKLISLQQKKIDKLKNIKKTCLKKMFV